MEILLRKDWRGKDVELLLAVPGFDATKWSESTKYSFDLPRKQAITLAVVMSDLLENQETPTYIITGEGGIRRES